jgi:hypothetical protein
MRRCSVLTEDHLGDAKRANHRKGGDPYEEGVREKQEDTFHRVQTVRRIEPVRKNKDGEEKCQRDGGSYQPHSHDRDSCAHRKVQRCNASFVRRYLRQGGPNHEKVSTTG